MLAIIMAVVCFFKVILANVDRIHQENQQYPIYEEPVQSAPKPFSYWAEKAKEYQVPQQEQPEEVIEEFEEATFIDMEACYQEQLRETVSESIVIKAWKENNRLVDDYFKRRYTTQQN